MENQGRFVLFITLSVVIMFGWYLIFPPPQQENAPAPVTEVAANSPETSPAQAKESVSAQVGKKQVPQHKTHDIPQKEVTVETDDYIATFSNKGAVLTGFQLKKYLNRETQKFIQLVNADSNRPQPFSVTYAPLPDLNQAMFEVTGSSKTLSKKDPNEKLVFRYVDVNGTVLEKSFVLKNDSYLIDFDVQVTPSGRGSLPASSLAVEWADTLGAQENTGTSSSIQGYRVATFTGDHVSFETPKKSQESVEIPSPIGWTALADQFFVAALIPDPSAGKASVKVARDFNVYNLPTEENPKPGVNDKIFGPRPLLVYFSHELKPGESFRSQGQAYIGPQNYNLLAGLHLQLENVIDFGKIVGPISVYMLKLLNWFYTWAKNWGISIILLSLLVKLLLWWPTARSIKHMSEMGKKMKEIQPQLDQLKKKYANDRQKLQQETLLLQQKIGINPFGGCLPMFLQMPVWIALYSTLSHCIELRGASFFLWIHDLSLKDPLYVLPVLMGVSMFATQWMTSKQTPPTGPQAQQQKFFLWFMPIVFTMFLRNTPSGLQLYILVSNLLSMLQNKIVYRSLNKKS